jgi:two-component system osmolarity sensor histidine kinase EnvZ
MSFQWLKRYMPRSLFGRAALILVLPVVTLQLVVSVVFVQRHFEDVTEQLSRELSRAVNLAMDETVDNRVDGLLGIFPQRVDDSAEPAENLRRWYDFTGLIVIRTLEARVRGLEKVDLPDDKSVNLYIRRNGQLWLVSVDRTRSSATNAHQLSSTRCSSAS